MSYHELLVVHVPSFFAFVEARDCSHTRDYPVPRILRIGLHKYPSIRDVTGIFHVSGVMDSDTVHEVLLHQSKT